MNYEQKYNEALERARDVYTYYCDDREQLRKIESIFPELIESEDEQIKKEIIAFLRSKNGYMTPNEDWDFRNRWLVWLEKQGNKIVDCQQNHQDVKYPNGGIVMEDFNGGEGFYKLHLDYLSKKQVKEVEEMVRAWNKEPKTSNENIKNCVEMCLTDANEQRFEDFGTTLKDCLAWLEKQGEQTTDKVEQKFKVGDWVIFNGTVAKILDKQKYGFIGLDIDGKDFFCNYGHTESMRLWAINDAKDGDVLANSNGNPFIFTGKFTTNYHNPIAYCGIGNENKFIVCALSWRFHWAEKKEVTPATKEQRDLLFAKMKEAGYEWNAEKKELKKIEVKTIDANKVIEWIDEHVPTKFEDMQNYVNQFKEDFGI